MINLNPVYDDSVGHFVVSADEPIRIEVVAGERGGVLALVYRGTKAKANDDPAVVYDSVGMEPSENQKQEAW